jgi:DNA adenine methylase
MMIRSPLRYPGGKSRAIANILEHIPQQFTELREPFVGGGSVFLHLQQLKPELKTWINDLNYDLYVFWKCVRSDLDQLTQEIWHIKSTRTDGKALFRELTQVDPSQLNELERAVRFFVLNRITFSGTIESGGFSQQAFEQRFTNSSIERLSKLRHLLDPVKITNQDYSALLTEPSPDELVFIFLDPPYFSVKKSKLYGKKGDLHTSFDHNRFAELLKKCPHPWLITYDDCPEIREKFDFAHIYTWELQYGMNNYKQQTASKGKELFIANYATHSLHAR